MATRTPLDQTVANKFAPTEKSHISSLENRTLHRKRLIVSCHILLLPLLAFFMSAEPTRLGVGVAPFFHFGNH